jgi:hypothetical protein
MNLKLFYKLPIELQSKIMFNYNIIHPICRLFKNFLFNIMPLSADIDKPSFVKHLKNLKILREIYINIEIVILNILFHHT